MRLAVTLAIALGGCASSDSTPPPADAPPGDAPRPVDTATVADTAAADAAAVADAPAATFDALPGPDGPAGEPRIHEIYVDRDLSGDKVEFVELAAPPGTPLDGLRLRLIDAGGQVDADVAVAGTGAAVGASGRWVVGGYNVSDIASPSRVDQAYSITTWGLDNTAGAVQLVRSGGTPVLLDVVGYGAAAVPPPASPPAATVEGSPVALPSGRGHGVGRLEGAADTGANATDLCAQAATPGYANGGCL